MTGPKLLVGTAGWSYPDWRGVFYPQKRPRGFDELSYLATYFDCVEVNNTFYRPPVEKWVTSWLRRTADNPDFTFAFKLHQDLTHKGVRVPGRESDAFREALSPALEAGRLGAVLAQFPWFFENTAENRGRIADLAGAFGDLSLVVEVRHTSWDVPAVWSFFEKLGVAFCNIDQPASSQGIGPTAFAGRRLGYFRFHGRNRKAWFDPKADRDEKYDYLYSEAELGEWQPRIEDSLGKARTTFAVGNNHFKAKAPANMLQLKSFITGEKVRVPPPLLEAYPLLRSIVKSE
jgi:uncharacterized protein YecE (DUF72 family)